MIRSVPNNRRLKREHPFTDLSDRVCQVAGCERLIKLRMVLLRDAWTCYPCWTAAKRERANGGRA